MLLMLIRKRCVTLVSRICVLDPRCRLTPVPTFRCVLLCCIAHVQIIAASVTPGSSEGDETRTSVSLTIGDIRASLLGDLLPHDLPLMSVDLTDFATKSTTVPTTLQACSSCLGFRVSVERYNPRLGAVEPVVEPFGAEAALVQLKHHHELSC